MGDSRNGISRLAGVIEERIRSQSRNADSILDYGTLGKNGTLKTDSFPENLDKNDYSVLESCAKDIKEGEKLRVLVAWVEDDPVIIGILAGQKEDGDG